MKTNAAGLEIICRNEGCKLTAYLCPAKVWTVGYGDTGPGVVRGLTITQEEAEARLAARLANEFEPGVQRAIGDAPTTENQFSAMVSLAYNIGVGAFGRSTVVRLHKAGLHGSVPRAFAMWNKAGGRIMQGLVRRRREEAELYARPPRPD